MRDICAGLKSALDGLKKPGTFLPTLWSLGRSHLGQLVRSPVVPVASPMLRPMAAGLARRVSRFGRTVEVLLIKYREAFMDRQYDQERIADAAIALVTAACTLSRWDHSLVHGSATSPDETAAELYMRMAFRRFDDSLRQLRHNDDRATTQAALASLRKWTSYDPLA